MFSWNEPMSKATVTGLYILFYAHCGNFWCFLAEMTRPLIRGFWRSGENASNFDFDRG
jgi:hypothetical protein